MALVELAELAELAANTSIIPESLADTEFGSGGEAGEAGWLGSTSAGTDWGWAEDWVTVADWLGDGDGGVVGKGISGLPILVSAGLTMGASGWLFGKADDVVVAAWGA